MHSIHVFPQRDGGEAVEAEGATALARDLAGNVVADEMTVLVMERGTHNPA
jgi:hypothetical protein